jgi:L-fucono-1,5-lactonase
MAALVVDAHHHLWDPARFDYPWLTEELGVIRRRFGAEDLAPIVERTGIDRTILVQSISSVDETREFLATAAATPFIAGVVGWVDLTEASVGDAIAALAEGEGGSGLVGIRHQVHDEPDPAWLLRADVDRGIAAVGAAGLVYDLLVRPRELPAALATVRAHPDVAFVIDHLAKPPIRSGELEPWLSLLRPFGALDNVACKASGLVTEADWANWRVADLQPFVDAAIEIFGPDRLMFGSDWPVCLLAGSYPDVLDATRTVLAELSAAEHSAVFGRTAIEVYRLAVDSQ